MTREEFIQILNSREYTYREEGDKIIIDHNWSVYLNFLYTLPEGIVFTNKDGVYLESLKILPNGIIFSNKGYVNLGSLKVLPEGTVFSNSGEVDLKSTSVIQKGIEFSNGGYVYLESLIGGWDFSWEGNIKGIDSKRLINKMISIGIFDKNK